MAERRPGASGEEPPGGLGAVPGPGEPVGRPAEPESAEPAPTGRAGRLGRSMLGGESSTPPAEAARAGGGAIGEGLRRRRAERGLTLSDVERDTRVNRSYLEALEAERWDALPAPVYTRGFLRAYGRHLGFDAEELIEMLPADLPRPAGLEPLPGLRRSGGAPPLEALNARVVLALVTAVAVVLAAAVLMLELRGRGDDTAEAPDATPTATSAASPAPAAGADPGGAGLLGGADTPAIAAPNATVPPAEEGTTPDFVGVTLEAARARLDELGFTPAVIEVATADAAPGQIFAQSPEAGQPLDEGDVVTLVVAAGAP